ncbi:MAG: hypothetical protein ACJARE_002119, partial [Paracoccaceae bacterium]
MTQNGQELSIALLPAADAAAVRAILENITYFNASDDPAESRLYAITVRDAAGTITQPSYVTVTVTPAKDTSLTQVVAPTLVNALTAGDQTAPDAASLVDGGWVIAWTDASNDGSGAGIYAQRFDAGGAPVDEMFAVAQTTFNSQFEAKVTALTDGGYAIAWTDGSGADGAEGRAMARLYNADGSARGGEIQLNATVAGDQSQPDLTAITGGFVAIWRSETIDGAGYAVVAQRFDAAGAPVAGEVTVNQHTGGAQTDPKVSSLPGGGFVAVWVSDDAQDGSGTSVHARIYDAAALPLTDEFQVNVDGVGAQWEPEITTLDDGGFVVVWRGDQSGVQTYGRVFNGDGTARTDEFRVNEDGGSSDYQPSVTALDGGGFVAAWYDANSWYTRDGDYAYHDTIAQVFDANGRRIDSEFRVADGGGTNQSSPTLTAIPGGGFAVAYNSNGAGAQGDGSGYGIVQAIYSDPAIYAALAAAAPQIEGLSAAATFAENAVSAAPQRIDADGAAALTLALGVDLDGARLTVRTEEGQEDQGHDPSSQHAFNLLTTGDLPGQVNHDGATVSYGGAAIGSMSTAGGVLEVIFTATATAEAAEAVIGLIAYANTSDAPLGSTLARVAFTDGAGRSVQQVLTLTITSDPDTKPEPIGSARQVNTTEAQDQTQPHTVELTGGGWVVVWRAEDAGGTNDNVLAQIYAADGSMIGAEITINQLTASVQSEPDVTALDDGGFFVAWRSETGDGSLSRVQASAFDAAGVRTVAEFQVNDYTNNYQYNPHVETLDNGDVAVIWVSRYQSYYQEGVGADDGVYGKIYSINTGIVSETMGETRLSDTVNGYQNDARIAVMTNGDFVVTYQAQNVDGSGYAVVAKLFHQDGTVAAAEFVLTQQTSSDQTDAEVSALAGGGFIATWASTGQDGSSRGIYARIFAEDGSPAGDEFRVNTNVTGDQYDPQVVGLASGGFAVVWYDAHYRGSYYDYQDLYGQIYDASGNRVDEEFRVSGSSYNDLSNGATLTALASGGFLAAWQNNSAASEFGDGSGTAIRLQIFGDPAGPLPVEQAGLADLAAATLRSPAEVLAGPVLIDPDLTVTDPDGAGFDGGALRIEISGGGTAEDTLALNVAGVVTLSGADVLVSGVTVGTIDVAENGTAGAPLTIAFNAAADAGTVEAVAEALTWASSLVDPTGAAKTFLYTLDDGSSGMPADGSSTLTVGAPPSIALTGFNTAPVITETMLEAGPVRLFPEAEFEYNALSLFGGGYVRLDHDYPSLGYPTQRPTYADDIFTVIDAGTGAGQIGFDGTTVTYEGTLIGTVDGAETGQNGANFKIALDAAATEASVRALIRALAYDSTSDTMGGTPYFDIEVRDGGGVTTGTQNVNLVIQAEADQPDAVTGEIQVNAETFDNQNGPFMARLADGNIITAWHSEQQDISGVDDWGVFIQLWDARGNKIGGEIQVNQTEAGEQYARDVTALSDGGFVVGFYNNADVFFRIHGADGQPTGDEVSAAEITSSTQTDISIAPLAAGAFMAVWTTTGVDGSGDSVAGRVFNADGSPASAEFQINIDTYSTQAGPTATTLSNGNVAVLWHNYSNGTTGDGSANATMLRIYTPSGAALTPTETVVNTYANSNQDNAVVAALVGGGFVTVWESYAQDGSGEGIFAQIFADDGTKVGGEFQVNDQSYSEQNNPEVIGLSGGGFVVAFSAQFIDGSGYGVAAKTYDAAGAATSDEFRVNTNISGNQYPADIVALDNDGFAVGFYSQTSGGSGDGSGNASYMRFYGDPAAYGLVADPVIVGFAPTVTFEEAAVNAGLQSLDAAIGFADGDTTDFDGGSLTLTRAVTGGNIDTFSAPDNQMQDQLGIITAGTGAGEISVIGATVSFEGVAFGTITSDGVDGAPLQVDFIAGATRPALEALIQALGYANVSDAPAATRTFGLTVDDGHGGRSDQQLITVTVTPEIDGIAALTGDQQVNSFALGEQNEAAIAQLSGGGYVVVWRSQNQALPGDNEYDVYARIFTEDGQPIGGEFIVGQTPQDGQYNPMVTGLDDGGFAVAWRDDNPAQDGSNSAVMGRVFDADGAARTDDFIVNVHTNDHQLHPAITAVPGGFVATWASRNQDGSDYGIWQRAFGNDGTALATEAQVNQSTSGTQYLPQIAAFDGGGHVVVWTSNASLALGGDGSGFGAYARRYDASGAALDDEQLVNSITSSDQYRPDVATFADGRYVIVWRDSAADGSGEGAYARLYGADGVPEGAEFRVALTAAGNQDDVHVAVLTDGRFAVGWTSDLNTDEGVGTGGGTGVFVQLFAADAARIDDPLVVSEERFGTQDGFEIAALAGGRFAVTWSSYYYNAAHPSDGSNYGVFTRVFGATGEAITTAAPVVAGVNATRDLTEDQVNAGPVLLDADGASSVTDGDTGDFGGAVLRVTRISAELAGILLNYGDDHAQDALSVRDQGAGPAQVGLSGATITYGGAAIGTLMSDGQAGADLTIAFAAGTTAHQVSAVIENLTYANASDDPFASRGFELTLTDPDGMVSAPQIITVNVAPQTDRAAPAGTDAQANSWIAQDQTSPAMATLSDLPGGAPTGYVVVWTSGNQDNNGDGLLGVFAQVYTLTGAPAGTEIQINSTVAGNQSQPTVVGTDGSGFMVAWTDGGALDGSSNGVFARFFDGTGGALTPEIGVTSTTLNAQDGPSAARLADGDIVIGWSGYGANGDRVYTQRFDAGGARVGVETQSSVDASGVYSDHQHASVAALAGGGYVVAFHANAQVGAALNDDVVNSYGVYATRYDGSGNALDASPVQINSFTYSVQYQPAAAGLADGGYVIAWQSYTQDSSVYGIFAQRFAADGSTVGGEFLVNESLASNQNDAAIIGLASGGFVIGWHDDYGNAWGQAYGADGGRVDGQFALHDQAAGTQNLAALTLLTGDEFVAAWASSTGDGSGYGVFQRIFGDVAATQAAPTLEGLPAEVTYQENTVNTAPQLLDADGAAAVSDLDSADFDGGSILVSVVGSARPLVNQISAPDNNAQDQFGVLATGTGDRAVTVSGNDIFVGGVQVAAVVQSGIGGAPLEIALNANADAQAVERIVESLSYRNISSDPIAERTVRVQITDGDGGYSAPQLVDVKIVANLDGATPILGERQANTFTDNQQYDPRTTTLDNGDVVIVWHSYTQDGSDWGVYGQLFNAAGEKLGAEFLVNSDFTTGGQVYPDVAALDGGGFVVSWECRDATHGGQSQDIFAQIYGVNTVNPGLPDESREAAEVGSEIQANVITASTQSGANVTGVAGGGFAVTWATYTSGGSGDGSGYGIAARIFDAGGTGGSELLVNTGANGDQSDPQIVTLANGDLMVTWHSADGTDSGDGSSWGVFAQRMDAAGNLLSRDGTTPGSDEFQINTYTASEQSTSAIAALADGGFVATWISNGQDGSGYGVYAQIYHADGSAQGQEFRVNEGRTSSQIAPEVAALSTGGFVIAWTTQDPYAETGAYNYEGVFAQQYGASGARIDTQFRVNTEVASSQNMPSITAVGEGGFLVAWASETSGTAGDGSARGVFYQLYGNSAPEVSADFAVDEDGLVILSIDAFDAGFVDEEGQDLAEIRIVSLPSAGALTFDGVPVTGELVASRADLVAGKLVYTPFDDQNGTDGFLFFASDGIAYSTEAGQATITIAPVNDAPGLEAGADAALLEGGTLTRTFTLTDPDSDTYGYVINWGDGSAPDTASSAAKALTRGHVYAAEGAYTVSVTVNDGSGEANGAETDTFAVTVGNAPPTPKRDNLPGTEDTGFAGNLLANNGYGVDGDPGGDPVFVATVAGQPVPATINLGGGLLTVAANGDFTFDPNGAFEALSVGQTSTQSFVYEIEDDSGARAQITSYVYVAGRNDAPAPLDDDAIVSVGSSVSDNVLTNDTDTDANDVLKVSVVAGSPVGSSGPTLVTLPSGATVSMQDDGAYTYDPNGAFPTGGTDSFDYTVSDGHGGFETATVDVTVETVNAAPTAVDDAFTVEENAQLADNVLTPSTGAADSDADLDALIVTKINGLAINVGVTITLASGAKVTVGANGSLGYDTNGAFEALGLGDTAPDSFTYDVSDGQGGSDTATVAITVAGENDAPVARRNDYIVGEDAALSGDAILDNTGSGVDSDVDGAVAELGITLINGGAYTPGTPVALPSGAALVMNADGTFDYTPGAAFNHLKTGQNAIDSFTYTLSDGDGGTSSALVRFTVTGANDAPTAQDDAFAIPASAIAAGSLLADNGSGADSDPDGDALAITHVDGAAITYGVPVTPAAGGQLTIFANGTFSYDPAGAVDPVFGTTQDVTFSYRVNDGNGQTNEATATITVSAAGSAPVATDDAFATTEEAGIAGNLITGDNGNGPDSDSDPEDVLRITQVNGVAANVGVQITLASGAKLSVGANGSMGWLPGGAFDGLAAGAPGQDSFTYTLSDGKG